MVEPLPLAPRPLPSTGASTGALEALAFFRDADFAQQRFEQFGNVYETRLLGQPLVFIRGGQAITDLLAQPDATEGWWPESVRQLLGSRSLANRNGADHRARRRVVGQLFSAAALRRYTPAIVTLVEELAAELKAATTPVPLVARMHRFAFTVIATVVLGLEGDDRDALFADFEIWTRALFSIPIALPGSPFSRALQARSRLLARLAGVLERARQQVAAGEPLAGGLDLLSGGLDEAGLPLTDDDLVEQLLLLLFAGYETTASSLSCLMAAVLQHPEVLPWLQAELDGLSWPLAEQEATPRLSAVVQEVMRLNPPVGGFFRRTTRDLVLDGVLVPAGRVVQVALAASNRFRSAADGGSDGGAGSDDLEQFRPERHLNGENGLTLLPYGGGERVCLGKALAELEIRLIAVGLLRQLTLQLEPDQDLSLQLIPSPSPRDGLLVRAEARS
ncbi:cytochrome P450 [Cyanobium sp. Aljojuca 7D2]|uniref:cytochrome P450 n=1 Tax=Cyanobium sp. Aljojuca 7D2 TaxID=2823698 RepID=UPI0039658A1D|nr:cytochrome P450 [Cyanobium sp. Aljojuca 7D2]